MMYGTRYRIEGALRLERDLHLGGARSERYTDQEGVQRERLVVMRGRDGPIIPASSLKGVLKDHLDDPAGVLGEASEHEAGRGKAARLWIENATVREESGGPRHDKHVSIDRRTGAALDNHLFEREMLPEGMVFGFAADWLDAALDDLAGALAPLCHGLRIGKGTSKGHGLVRLDASDLVIRKIGADDGGRLQDAPIPQAEREDLVRQIAGLEPARRAGGTDRRIVLDLACEGPFLSIREIGPDGNEGARNVANPMMRAGRPWLHPESVVGALRSRAAWLAEVGRARAPAEHRPETMAMDDWKLEHALGNQRRVASLDDVEALSWVERLFGVTGWKSRIELVSLECTQPGTPIVLTSNSLDRVTGATREGFLFARSAHWDPVFRVELAVPEDEAMPELDDLLESLVEEGIELGHATTKGFGWFEVSVVEDSGKDEGP